MSRVARRTATRAAVKERPRFLTPVPRAEWPAWPPGDGAPPVELWCSRTYLVQVFAVPFELGAILRITVCRTDRQPGISWDDLQEVKRQIGRGSLAAVELYPPDARVVNVAAMRHLWVLPAPPAWMWGGGA